MIPMGANPSRISSAPLRDVARNCFVISSPKRERSGARSVNALFSKFEGSTDGAVTVAVAPAVVVGLDMSNVGFEKVGENVKLTQSKVGGKLKNRNLSWSEDQSRMYHQGAHVTQHMHKEQKADLI